MKFIRNNRIKDRIIDLGTKAVLFLITALICLWMVSGAKAEEQKITEINQSKNQDGTYSVEFKFSSKLTKEDVALDFQRNFIQVSLKNVSAFPARTKTLNHPSLDKVFTYQYQPDLARARILLKSQASSIQDKTSWDIKENILSIKLSELGGDSIAANSKKRSVAKDTVKDSVKNHAAASNSAKEEIDAEDSRLVNEIINNPTSPEVVASANKTEEKKPVLTNTEDQPIFSSQTIQAAEAKEKSASSPIAKIFASLMMVIGIIGAGALAFRRFVLGKGITLTRQGRMIEVIANQSMGPKRSIAIVKVLDQYMVVGMSGDSMNLLTNLGTNVNLDKFNDDPLTTGGLGASFSSTFKNTLENNSFNDSAPANFTAPVKASMRDVIKKRISGFKPL